MCPHFKAENATVAQAVEQAFRKRQVKGSNPFGGFFVLSTTAHVRLDTPIPITSSIILLWRKTQPHL